MSGNSAPSLNEEEIGIRDDTAFVLFVVREEVKKSKVVEASITRQCDPVDLGNIEFRPSSLVSITIKIKLKTGGMVNESFNTPVGAKPALPLGFEAP